MNILYSVVYICISNKVIFFLFFILIFYVFKQDPFDNTKYSCTVGLSCINIHFIIIIIILCQYIRKSTQNRLDNMHTDV